MNKILTALLTGLLVTGFSCATPAAFAETGVAAAKKVTQKKTHGKKAVPAKFELAAPDEDDTGPAIDTKNSLATDYKCELGAILTIFRNEGDDKYIALHFQKVLTRMQRVSTTTGANRFENKHTGLIWIGIPAKGILLDAKQGHQLANECKDADQLMPKAVVAATSKTATDDAPKNVAADAPKKMNQ